MPIRIRHASLALLTFAAACAEPGPMSPVDPGRPLLSHAPSHPAVRFSEIHYDNASTDAGERIEVSFPAGTDLTGWRVVLYNGSNGLSYDTDLLSSGASTVCGSRAVVVLSYAVNGIQNGAPDGMALVNGSTVVEFLSYEGSFTALDGPANGATSTDIGISQAGDEPVGSSLQRYGFGVWTETTGSNSFGACNDPDPPPPAEVASVTVSPASATIEVGDVQQFTATAFDASSQPIAGVTFTWSSSDPSIAAVSAGGLATGVAPGDVTITATAPNDVFGTAALHVDPAAPLPPVRFSELHYDNVGTDFNEAIELEGPAGTNLVGWTLILYNGNGGAPYNTRLLSGTFSDQCSGRGVLVFPYPQDGLQNGAPDGMALVDPNGTVIEFLSYEGAFTAVGGAANGMTSTNIGVAESSSPVGQSLQRNNGGAWTGPAANGFGVCFGFPPPPPSNAVIFSGRNPTDPPLPVGFQDQLFATLLDPNGVPVTTTFTWSSDTPAIAGIDQNGVFTGVGVGTAVLRATAADGSATTATFALPVHVATASATAQYAGNAEFGEPADLDASDDFILRHPQFTTSWNPNRGTPNWVSYDIDATHFGAQDRCDCFTFDPALPAAFTRYTTASYTGAGAFHGYGIDRGHLARSFDRTAGSLDNAFTFYFTNIIPQAADNNQGPWAALESFLGDFARLQNKEVYVIAGVAGSKGTVKNEGLITIPAQVWKVALMLPRDQGLADVDHYLDPQVVAVIMPNDPGIRNVPWQTYQATVDQIEALTGYDLLALLPDQIEIAIESNTAPPTAAVNGPYTSIVNEPVAMSGAASSDPDGHALTYHWSFGDGGTGSGVSVSHAYASPGVFTVQLTVTDILGLTGTVTTTASVISASQAVQNAIAIVMQLVAGGKLNAGNGNSLTSKLEGAKKQLDAGKTAAAVDKLQSLLEELSSLVSLGRISAADAAPLRMLVERIIASLG